MYWYLIQYLLLGTIQQDFLGQGWWREGGGSAYFFSEEQVHVCLIVNSCMLIQTQHQTVNWYILIETQLIIFYGIHIFLTFFVDFIPLSGLNSYHIAIKCRFYHFGHLSTLRWAMGHLTSSVGLRCHSEAITFTLIFLDK